MKYFPALMLAVLTLGLVACGGGVQLPPVAPEDVEVYLPGSFPSESYEVMATIREDAHLNTPDQELIDEAKVRAAEMGADALIITSIRRTTEGQIETDLRQEQLKILEGRAVYFPSRHPELGEQDQ